MNINTMSKQEILGFLLKDGLKISKKDQNLFLSFDGNMYEFLAKDKRCTQTSLNVGYCLKNSEWFRNNATKEILELVTMLSLSNRGLTEIPDYVFRLSNLEFLQLCDNQITEIPSGIGKLAKLKELLLERNELTFISPEIGKLTELTRLFLTNNKLSVLPTEIGNCKSLALLKVRKNNLTTIYESTSGCVSLKEICA